MLVLSHYYIFHTYRSGSSIELLFHISMIFTAMAVSMAGLGRPNSFFRHRGGPMPEDPVFPDSEGEDRFLVNPLNVDVLNFGPRPPKGGQPGFPWSRSSFTGPQQSPIDIIRCKSRVMKYNKPLIIDYAKTDQKEGIVVEISNSGHGVNIKVPNLDARPALSGGMLKNRYVFENIHLHWGEDDTMGSEHFMDGEAFSMECHMVTYNSKYKDLNEALNNKDDGVVVYAFFYKVKDEGTKDNMNLQNLLDYIPKIQENGAKFSPANQEALLWVLEPIEINKEYFVYPGSLTTPKYTEAVTFIILPEPVPVSRQQIAVLRTLMDNHTPSEPVKSNRREIQSLNQRPVINVKGAIKPSLRMIAAEPINNCYYCDNTLPWDYYYYDDKK